MIELKKISKSYATQSGTIQAIADIDLNVPSGKIFGVIGKSGAGKSTLVRCINLLERPDQGDVLLDQQSLMNLSAKALRRVRNCIGMVFQHFNLLSSRTVHENIALPLELNKKPKKAICETVLPLLDLVGLTDCRHCYPSQLSGGQKQRVAIARALVNQPKLLLCDEMTSALDPKTTQSILDLLKDIHAKMALTILLITHEMDVIERVCDQVAVMDKGRIIEQGSVLQIFQQPKHQVTRELTRSAFHLKLPEVLANKIQPQYASHCSTLMQITFVGESASQPLMNDLIRRFNLSVNILQSNLEIVHTKPVGMMLVGLVGRQQEVHAAKLHLQTIGLNVEIIGYVERDDWHFN